MIVSGRPTAAVGILTGRITSRTCSAIVAPLRLNILTRRSKLSLSLSGRKIRLTGRKIRLTGRIKKLTSRTTNKQIHK